MLRMRSSNWVLLKFEPEIEKTLQEISKEQREVSEKENWQEDEMVLV